MGLSAGSEHVLRTALGRGATLAAAVCVLLFLADVGSGLAAHLGCRPSRLTWLGRRSPRPLRRLAELTVTALVAIAVARPAGASTTPVRDWLSQTTSPTTAPSVPTSAPVVPTTARAGLAPSSSSAPPTPTTTVGGPTPPAPAAPTPAPAAGVGAAPPRPSRVLTPVVPTATYVVRPGDCLWLIAARLLGTRASNRAVDAGWRAIYAANRASIGDDPNLIHAGLVLTLPPLPADR